MSFMPFKSIKVSNRYHFQKVQKSTQKIHFQLRQNGSSTYAVIKIKALDPAQARHAEREAEPL